MIDKNGSPPNAYDSDCPTRQVLDRVADKWTVLVLLLLARKPTRFNELRRAIQGISQKMLSQTLRTLERDGLVNRKVIATVPVTVEYSITPLGRTLASRWMRSASGPKSISVRSRWRSAVTTRRRRAVPSAARERCELLDFVLARRKRRHQAHQHFVLGQAVAAPDIIGGAGRTQFGIGRLRHRGKNQIGLDRP